MHDNIENKIQYLEMIQGVITRMAWNSFTTKGWAIALVIGIFASAIMVVANKIYCLLAYIPIIVFWFLDTYYLQLERKYRALYEKVRVEDAKGNLDIKISVSNIGDSKNLWYLSCFTSIRELGFYLPFTALIFVVTFLAKFIKK